jgi:hypothetical protein
MIELLLLSILTTLVVLTLRRGKPVILENPLVIHRVGKYHITLAPQLNVALRFVESIAQQYLIPANAATDAETQYFMVYDAQVCTGQDKFYLLAVSLRKGILFFQAIQPQPLLYDSDSYLKTVQTFAAAVLIEQEPARNNEGKSAVQQAVNNAAQAMSLTVQFLA